MEVLENPREFDLGPLLENRKNKDTSPINIFIAKVSNYPIHLHSELEIIYVLKGSIELRSSVDKITLSTGDIYIVNSMDMHEIACTDDENMVLFIHIDLQAYKDYASKLDHVIFASASSNESTIKEIKKFITEIYSEKQEGKIYNEKINNLTIKLILHLMNHCQFANRYGNTLNNNSKFKDKRAFHMERIQRVSNYIYTNYYKKITLEEVAKKEYISKYYLSHTIKNAVGLSFQELLTLVRIEESEKLLLATNLSIEEVAYISGCSSPLYYYKNFKLYFKDTPSEYRRKNKPNTIGNRKPEMKVIYDKDLLRKSKIFLTEKTDQLDSKSSLLVQVPINLENKSEPIKATFTFKVCLEVKDIKSLFNPIFIKMVSQLSDELKLSGIAMNIFELNNMYEFLGSWNWMSPLLQLMKKEALVMIIDEEVEGRDFLIHCQSEGVRCEIGERVRGHKNSIRNENEALQGIITSFFKTEDLEEIKTSSYTYVTLDENLLFYNCYENLLRSKAYYQLSLLALLKGEVIGKSNEHIAVRHDESLGIFLYNSDSIVSKELIVNINNIDKYYSVIQYDFTEDDYDERELYRMLGSPKKVTREMEKAMESVAYPKATFSMIGETFVHDFYIVLPPNRYAFIVMKQV